MGNLIISKVDHLKDSVSPFVELYDGTKVPFGEYFNGEGEDHLFHINYDTTSRYGYMRHPIWAVLYKEEGTWRRYRIFIGEAPHKNENGEWVTYNDVPSFVMGPFGGTYFIDREPDIPHLIDIQTDEFFYNMNKEQDKVDKNIYAELSNYKHQLRYCTFKDYLNGLKNRTKLKIGEFSHYTGTIYKYTMFTHPTKSGCTSFSLFKKLDGSELYFKKETEDWIDLFFLKKSGKICFQHDKLHNDHINSAC